MHPVKYTAANRGPEDINLVVLHLTDGEGDAESVTKWWYDNGIQASYHTLIDRDGKVNRLVEPEDIAWHAGNWSVNERSLGLSFVSDYEKFRLTREQMLAGIKVLARWSYDYELSLRRTYPYAAGRIPMPFGVGQHRNVQGATHVDMHPSFDIIRFAAEARSWRNQNLGAIKVEKR